MILLAGSGLASTALRNGFYSPSDIAMMGEALKTGTLETAEVGKFFWATHEDLAEAAATILLDEDRFDGPSPPLPGAGALDFGDLAAIASEVI